MCHSAMSLCSKWSKLRRTVQDTSLQAVKLADLHGQKVVLKLMTLLQGQMLILSSFARNATSTLSPNFSPKSLNQFFHETPISFFHRASRLLCLSHCSVQHDGGVNSFHSDGWSNCVPLLRGTAGPRRRIQRRLWKRHFQHVCERAGWCF